jgi:hypothetical protein
MHPHPQPHAYARTQIFNTYCFSTATGSANAPQCYVIQCLTCTYCPTWSSSAPLLLRLKRCDTVTLLRTLALSFSLLSLSLSLSLWRVRTVALRARSMRDIWVRALLPQITELPREWVYTSLSRALKIANQTFSTPNASRIASEIFVFNRRYPARNVSTARCQTAADVATLYTLSETTFLFSVPRLH